MHPEIAVEEQLELRGMPVMELTGVVYHNGPTYQSGHYTCLCRGPGGRFWFYDDKGVHKMSSEVAHIKPREVVMAVYCKRDGSATWKQHVRDEGVVEVDPVDGGGLSPVRRRRLRSKTPSLAESPAGGRRRENVTGTEQCDNLASPNRRRLSRKISAEIVAASEASAVAPAVSVSTARGQCDAAPTPKKRQLARMTSEEMTDAIGGGSCASVASPARRLRTKTPSDAASPVIRAALPGENVIAGREPVDLGEMMCDAEDSGGVSSIQTSRRSPTDAPAALRSSSGASMGLVRQSGASSKLGAGGSGSLLKRRRGARDREGSGGRVVGAMAEWLESATRGGGSDPAATTSALRASASSGSAVSQASRPEVASVRRTSAQVSQGRRGVVSGFGAERTTDALGDAERRDVEANLRARQMRDQGERARARDLENNDIGPWLGR